MQSLFKTLLAFIRYLVHQISRHNLFNLASTLAFTSLLAFVPLFTVIFALLSNLPGVQDLSSEFNHFVLTYFIPDVGADIEGLMQGFIGNAMRMQVWGFLSLIVTALMMIATIDKAIHAIWDDAGRRSAWSSLLIYWIVLFLTPITLAVSIGITSYFGSLKWMDDVPQQIGLSWSLILPWLSTSLGLTLLYWAIPTPKVRLTHALTGAVFAAFLFELSKRLFGLYIAYFPVQEAIFGALAALPLILIWLFVSWLVILLGAEITRALGFVNDFSEQKNRSD